MCKHEQVFCGHRDQIACTLRCEVMHGRRSSVNVVSCTAIGAHVIVRLTSMMARCNERN